MINKGFLIICLIVLDILLVRDILLKQARYSAQKNDQVLSENTKEDPTLTPTQTPTTTLIPTLNPSKEDESSSSLRIDTVSQSINIVSSLPLLKQINDFRSSKGMDAVSENSETCSFASTRANEISSNFNHDGFTNRANSNSLPYPSFSSVAENIAMNSDASQVVPNWINSPGHAENLLKDVPYGCVANNGNYYTFEAWKP